MAVLAGGPLLGILELVEAEHGELAGDHPCQRMQRMGDPISCRILRRFVLKAGMMLEESAEAQLQVLDRRRGRSLVVTQLLTTLLQRS